MPAPRGASADLNVWKPGVGIDEVTVTYVRVTDGESTESIEAGWMTDGKTGCYNLDCPGFVQKSQTLTLGAEISPISTYGGQQYQFNIKIYQDIETGDWWLLNGEKEIGYWPKNLFDNLHFVERQIEWGGKATKSHRNEIAQMGSGHFSGEGLGKAAYVADVQYAVENGIWNKAPVGVKTLVSRPDCYDINSPESTLEYDPYFFYGGDGKACSRD
ncbi:hypothetical protein LINPERPRIM_LOCUS26981 [Linum perenne]